MFVQRKTITWSSHILVDWLLSLPRWHANCIQKAAATNWPTSPSILYCPWHDPPLSSHFTHQVVVLVPRKLTINALSFLEKCIYIPLRFSLLCATYQPGRFFGDIIWQQLRYTLPTISWPFPKFKDNTAKLALNLDKCGEVITFHKCVYMYLYVSIQT